MPADTPLAANTAAPFPPLAAQRSGQRGAAAWRRAAGFSLALLALLAQLACAGRALAQGTPAAPAVARTDQAPDRDSTDRLLSSTRQSVRLAAEGLARGVDSWFGDRPFEDGGRVTEGQLSFGMLSRQHEPLESRVRFHARWRLPNLGDRSYVYLGQGDRTELVKDQPAALGRSQQLRSSRNVSSGFFAGLGTSLRDVLELRLGFRGGLKPYAQASFHHDWALSAAGRLDFRETLFWTLDDHLGSTTALSYEHALTPSWTGRWLTAATVSQRKRDLEWSSNLGAYKHYGQQRRLSLEILFSGVQGSGVGLSDIGLQTKWEQPIHRDWLIAELIVGHFWPRQDASSAREQAWALGAGMRLKF